MWHRMVLDEAHAIRNRKTLASQSVMQLSKSAQVKWALTGTIIQNGPDDCYSLLRFLRVQPVNDHPIFSASISKPIKQGDPTGLSLLRLILTGITMRRSNDILANSLPPRTTLLAKVPFSSVERGAYDNLFKSALVAVEALAASGDLLSQVSHHV